MKKLLIIILAVYCSQDMNAQFRAIPDTFNFSDTNMSYIVYPTRNDSIVNPFSIYSTAILSGSGYTVDIQDSLLGKLLISDAVKSTMNGSFRYYLKNKTTNAIDSVIVYFYKIAMNPDVFPGEANQDGKINHLDLLSIGQAYGKFGSPRNSFDLNTSFSPKKVGFWNQTVNSVDLKHIDINGDGLIDSMDIIGIISNKEKITGPNYLPKLSPSSTTNFITAKALKDTFDLNKDTATFSIPLKINYPGSLSSYGIGYTYSIVYSGNDTPFYGKSQVKYKSNLWSTSTIEMQYQISNQVKSAAVKKDRKNSDLGGPDMGTVEIVVDVIGIGAAKQNDVIPMKLIFSEIALIDKDYNLIPISPKPYSFYVKYAKAGISNSIQDQLSVFPTLFQSNLTINKSGNQRIKFSIYNALGSKVYESNMKETSLTFDPNIVSSGVYFLKVEGRGDVFRLIKQ